MNGRPLHSTGSSSQKNLLFHNIRYVKPTNLLKQIHHDVRNLYYDNNPYYLNNHPLNNRVKGIYNTTRNSNHSRDLSQTSSQSSTKIVRANGLRLAEKPKLIKNQQRQPSLSQSRNTEQTKRLYDRNIQLQQQNRSLKQQNNKLCQMMRSIDESHKKQIFILNSKFQSLFKKTQQLQSYVQQENNQWRKKISQISSYSDIKTTNFPQANQNIISYTNLSTNQYQSGSTNGNVNNSSNPRK